MPRVRSSLGGGQAEDRAQHRTDAGRPPRPERHADQGRAQIADRLVLQMHPALLGERIRP